MNKILLLIILVIFPNIYGQNRFIVSFSPGLYLYNSENFLHITDDYKISSYPGISAAFELKGIWSYKLHMEYNFTYYGKLKMVGFIPYETNSLYPNRSLFANYFLTSHNYDISLVVKLSDNFNYYFGPSLAVYNRTTEYGTSLPAAENPPNMYDKLVSFCIGLNGAVNFELPLSEGNNHFLLYSGLKLRYLHSIFFDKRGRDVSNYSQSFLTAQLNLGIGYNL